MSALIRQLASRKRTRAVLNRVYRALSFSGKAAMHARYGGIFRGRADLIEAGVWTVDFVGRQIALPLRPDQAWLDWDGALSILGHEPDIKRTYQTLLRGRQPPRVFFDVGANYGLHSLLFLVHGVRTISFEPNPACHDYLRAAGLLNGVVPTFAPAVGARTEEVTLRFPPREEWLGSTTSTLPGHLIGRTDLEEQTVEQTTIDQYVQDSGIRPDLIKIDTEDGEEAVLRGAVATLRNAGPRLIFESWAGSDRTGLYDRLTESGYVVRNLPLRPGRESKLLDREAFFASHASDFLAEPG